MIRFTQADDNNQFFAYNDLDQLYHSCWNHSPDKSSYYAFCVVDRKLELFVIINNSRFQKSFNRYFGTNSVDAAQKTKSMKSVNKFFEHYLAEIGSYSMRSEYQSTKKGIIYDYFMKDSSNWA